ITNKDTFGFPDQYQTISGFLRLFAKTGNFELLAFTDNLRTNYFYRLARQPLQELKFKMFYDENRVNEIHEFRQQLNSIFSNEIKKRNIQAHLEKVNYTEESLIGLLEKLTPVEKRKNRVKSPAAGLVVAAGASINFLKVTGDNLAVVNTSYSPSISPVLSIGYMSPVTRGFGRVFVYPEIKLYSFKNSGEINDGTVRRTASFKTPLAIAPLLNIGVNIANADQFKYFISIGAGMTFLIKGREQDQVISTTGTQTFRSTELDLAKLTYNAHLSTGVFLNNKIIIAATYNVPVPVSNFIYYTPSLSSVHITVGYKL
ncbi:MAG TPA: hypothetical protein VF610_11340, partial [Segetibacter sp.]